MIQGCASGPHTEEAQVEPTKAPPTSKVTKSAELVDGKEVYTSGPPPVAGGGTTTAPVTTAMPTLSAPEVIIEEEDDLSIPVPVGTVCRRKACGTAFVSDEVNRIGDGDATVCRYHSAPVRTSFIVSLSLLIHCVLSLCLEKAVKFVNPPNTCELDLKHNYRAISVANDAS